MFMDRQLNLTVALDPRSEEHSLNGLEARDQGISKIYVSTAENRPRTSRCPNRQDGSHPTVRDSTVGGPITRNHRHGQGKDN